MNSTMKSPVAALQEMMANMAQTPDYECMSQPGQQQAMFSYRCSALGVIVTAEARSKKGAKQEAARLMLRFLAARQLPVPPPYGLLNSSRPSSSGSSAATAADAWKAYSSARCYIASLHEVCSKYGLATARYELVGVRGPPHQQLFTVVARAGQHESRATETTKKAARQLAAGKLFCYLRENLTRLTSDFIEDEALVSTDESDIEQDFEPRDERRTDPNQKVAEYHLALVSRLDEGVRESALQALDRSEGGEEDLMAA